jgi:hypothetical protein
MLSKEVNAFVFGVQYLVQLVGVDPFLATAHKASSLKHFMPGDKSTLKYGANFDCK